MEEYHTTKIEYFNIHMFSSDLPRFILKAVVGLKKDHKIRSENIDIKVQGGVFFPSDSYYTCDPLPMTWVELFDK